MGIFWEGGGFFFFLFVLKTILIISLICVASTLGSSLLLKLLQEKREKQKKLKNYDKLLEVSIIISVGCLDNSTMMFNIMEKFTKERCVLALCALERRKSFKTTSKWYANFTFLAL